MLTFLLVVQAIVGTVLVGVILMQQSEGGGLGMGGSPSGLMSARGAADFLTRATTVLASIFIGLSILHAVLATRTTPGANIDTSLARKPVAEAPAVPPPAPAVPLANEPLPVTPPTATVAPRSAERTPERPARSEPRTEPRTVKREAPAASPAVVPSVTPAPSALPAPSNAN